MSAAFWASSVVLAVERSRFACVTSMQSLRAKVACGASALDSVADELGLELALALGLEP
jgi:hypothetical protein